MTYLQDFIYALKGIAAPFALIFMGALLPCMHASHHGDGAALIGLVLFLTGIAWVVYLSFFSRD